MSISRTPLLGPAVRTAPIQYDTLENFISQNAPTGNKTLSAACAVYGAGPVLAEGKQYYCDGASITPLTGPSVQNKKIIRIAFIGDSTAEGVLQTALSASMQDTTGTGLAVSSPDLTYWGWEFTGGTVTRDYNNHAYCGDYLFRFYPKAMPALNFGIGGQKIADILARESNTTGDYVGVNRRAISDLANYDIDVIICRAGINNFNGNGSFASATNATLSTYVAPAIADAKTLIDRLEATGKIVLFDSLLGWNVATATASLSRQALNIFNSEIKKYCATKPTVYFVETGTTATDGRWKSTAASYTPDGLHETTGAMLDISAAEAAVLETIYGPSYGWRYEDLGTNLEANPNFVNTTATPSGATGVAGTQVAFSIGAGTGANAKIEYRDGKVWQTVEVTSTANNCNLTLVLYENLAANFVAGDYMCVEFEWILEPLSPSTVLPAFSTLQGKIDLNGPGSGIQRFQLYTYDNSRVTGATIARDKCVFAPIKIPTGALDTGNYGHSIQLNAYRQATGGTTDAFKVWVSAPVIVKVSSPAVLT